MSMRLTRHKPQKQNAPRLRDDGKWGVGPARLKGRALPSTELAHAPIHQGDLSKRELAHGANSAKSLRDIRVPLDPPKLLWQGALDGFYLWIEGKSSKGCHSLRKGDVKVCGSLVRYAAGPIPSALPTNYNRQREQLLPFGKSAFKTLQMATIVPSVILSCFCVTFVRSTLL